ncbi:hypothetical protein [Evansella cellulosilytica]|uniref:Uncharacterized protein n=1 Tax=Evansella cellulosilytica (strain ATCC 21833 / DSM 2522 / FERM P-1141 / JCM 9156 / N-4) TaxID=649639 RepID=E6TXW6_EVAC2|nr:hypothetical protein [Evansella cellulosilytica]ADU31179.1 hypothetical protein Bcell_2928 [Evansella cellulosilytica DSM 2522]
MLSVKITYKKEPNLHEFLEDLGFKNKNGIFVKKLSKISRKELKGQLDKDLLVLTFPENVTMDDCEQIYGLIKSIDDNLDCHIDDAKAHLGYDSEGNKVNVYHGFPSWTKYINKAKHRSLEGQRVVIFHGEEELGHGILLTYEEVVSDDHKIKSISCTLLTTSGEQSFFGEDLHLEPLM